MCAALATWPSRWWRSWRTWRRRISFSSTLGNDLVDLRDPESDPASLHPRFDARVFGDAERDWIGASARRRWRIWAAKEAAYKAGRKRDPRLIFSPRRIRVSLCEDAGDSGVPCHGLATADGLRFALRVRDDGRRVHALALHTPAGRQRWSEVVSAEGPVEGKDPSRGVRELALRHLARFLGVCMDDLEIRREGRIPRLWIEGAPANLDLSLSHHGGWVGFAAIAPPSSEPTFACFAHSGPLG